MFTVDVASVGGFPIGMNLLPAIISSSSIGDYGIDCDLELK